MHDQFVAALPIAVLRTQTPLSQAPRRVLSLDLEKATTRHLLDGLRSFIASFDAQRELARRADDSAFTESAEHHAQAVHFSDALPRLQGYAVIGMLAAIAEARLTTLCDGMQSDNGLTESVSDLRGPIHERVYAYLAAHLRPPPSDLWEWICDVLTVRQCVTHHAGSVATLDRAERQRLEQVIKRRPGLAIVQDDILFNQAPHAVTRPVEVLSVRVEFCSEAITAARGLFGYLYQQRDTVPVRRRQRASW